MRMTWLISHTAGAALPGTGACPRSLACEAQLLFNVEERVDAGNAAGKGRAQGSAVTGEVPEATWSPGLRGAPSTCYFIPLSMRHFPRHTNPYFVMLHARLTHCSA